MKTVFAALAVVLCAQMGLAQEKNADENKVQASMDKDMSSDKTWSVEFNPIGLILGLNAEAAFKVTPQITVGPTLSYINFSLFDTKYTGTGVGVVGRYYFNEAYTSSWYLASALTYANATAEMRSSITGENLSASASTFGLSALGGYTWAWTSFFMRLGGGIYLAPPNTDVKTRNSVGSEETISVKTASSSLGLEFNLGWAF